MLMFRRIAKTMLAKDNNYIGTETGPFLEISLGGGGGVRV